MTIKSFGCGEIYNMKIIKKVMKYLYPYTIRFYIIGNFPIIWLARVYFKRLVNVENKLN